MKSAKWVYRESASSAKLIRVHRFPATRRVIAEAFRPTALPLAFAAEAFQAAAPTDLILKPAGRGEVLLSWQQTRDDEASATHLATLGHHDRCEWQQARYALSTTTFVSAVQAHRYGL